jgi:hypothetical protein
MINTLVRIAVREISVEMTFVRRQQADAVRDGLVYEPNRCSFLSYGARLAQPITFALYRTDYGDFVVRSALATTLIPMLVFIFATDPCLVDFDNTTKFPFRLHHCRTDFVAHAMRCFVRAKAHNSLDLQGANALLAGRHQMNDAEPIAEGLIVLDQSGGR